MRAFSIEGAIVEESDDGREWTMAVAAGQWTRPKKIIAHVAYEVTAQSGTVLYARRQGVNEVSDDSRIDLREGDVYALIADREKPMMSAWRSETPYQAGSEGSVERGDPTRDPVHSAPDEFWKRFDRLREH